MAPGHPELYAPIKANQYRGKVRVSSFTLTLASQVSGTSFAVVKIPKGARILSGELTASATLANSATLAVGLAAAQGTAGQIDDTVGATVDVTGAAATGPVSDATACLKAAAAQGTAKVVFAATQALGYLYETAKDVYLTLTTGTGTVATEKVMGHVIYVVE